MADTILDLTRSYKTYLTWGNLTASQQAFATSLGYSAGTATIAAGQYLNHVLQAVSVSPTDVVVDANGDPVCNVGTNSQSIEEDISLAPQSAATSVSTYSGPTSGSVLAQTSIASLSLFNPSPTKTMYFRIDITLFKLISSAWGRYVTDRFRLYYDNGGGTLSQILDHGQGIGAPSPFAGAPEQSNDQQNYIDTWVLVPPLATTVVRIQAERQHSGESGAGPYTVLVQAVMNARGVTL